MDTVGLQRVRRLGEQYGLRGLLAISFTNSNKFAVVSWGKDKLECGEMRKVGEKIAQLIEAGEVEVPPVGGSHAD